ncbi:amidohydrolase [Leucobacter luti]|uniref:amidohydrolase n=1 Tax=Leucobacter luti TaxID=340320 RepID=UPI001FB1E80E|nr:amidohydrolase [Leucobacter luti]MCW2289484.1 putative amidohydrolase YtcJ [Leucobacter luti]
MAELKADLIIASARVHTMVAGDENTAPRSIAIADGRVLAVGSDDDIAEAFRGPQTRVDDGAGVTVTPGLIDAHLHPIQGVELCQGADLGAVRDLRDLRNALSAETARVRERGGDGWVRAWNLDYAAFDGATLSSHLIDEAVDGMPALLFFFDFHTAIASTEALRRSGITGARAFEDSSEIIVDASGAPTGELREDSAYQPILEVAPKPSRAETLESARATFAKMRRSGLTGGTIMDGNSETLDLLEALDTTGLGLPVRIVSAMDVKPTYTSEQRAAIRNQRDRAGARWRGGVIKLYADGVIDTGAGWLYEADTDGDGLAGFWPDQTDFVAAVQEFTAAGFQIATHAIGDRAVGETITAYEGVGARSRAGIPHRIEHLETLDPRDVARLAAAGITASMQLPHLQWRIADGSDEWARRLGPQRAARGWNAASVLAAGAPLALGSDWPIADLDARFGLAWAMLRRAPGARDAFVYEPEQRLSAAQALHGYTRGAALAQGDDDLGIIRPGARADLAVWAEDPLTVPGDDLAELPVIATYLDGLHTSHAA